MLLQVGLGPVFGPHAGGFLAGVLAASYAAGIRKNHPTGSGRDILSPLIGTSWDVLCVGGVSAVLSVLFVPILASTPVIREADSLALSIIIITFAGRALFHREAPCGNMESIRKIGWLKTDNYAISWVGWMSPPSRLLMIGAGIGGVSGALAKFSQTALAPLVAAGTVTDAAAGTVCVIFGWSLCAIMLTCLQLGQGETQKVPVAHCMAVLAAVGFLSTGSLGFAVVCGIFGAFLQELCARMFINHGSDHLDPPAAGIAIGVFVLNILLKPAWLGLSNLF